MKCHEELTSQYQNRILNLLLDYFNNCPAPKLKDAMSYSIVNGGKRLRPLLVYATGETLSAPLENLDVAATAIELIHTYSLIHDDLPAMDNADLRRGKPACHIAFNEAFAILAGDALQTLAFEIIASHPAELTVEQRLSMIRALTRASGYRGMVAGQVKDMEAPHTVDTILSMYALKTGALIKASIEMGVIAANNHDQKINASLAKYGELIGLAFQLQDDLLDIETSSTVMGKPQGLDAHNNKITYPALSGIDSTRAIINDLIDQALTTVEYLGKKADILKELAHYILRRKN